MILRIVSPTILGFPLGGPEDEQGAENWREKVLQYAGRNKPFSTTNRVFPVLASPFLILLNLR